MSSVFWDTSPLPMTGAPGDNPDMREVKLSSDASPVAREVYRRMAAAKLGQKALALKADVNETYVRDLYVGKSKNPKQQQLAKIAKALDCTLDDLLHPERAEETQDAERTAKTPQEFAVLIAFRSGGREMRRAIVSAIESVALGALAGFGEADDV